MTSCCRFLLMCQQNEIPSENIQEVSKPTVFSFLHMSRFAIISRPYIFCHLQKSAHTLERFSLVCGCSCCGAFICLSRSYKCWMMLRGQCYISTAPNRINRNFSCFCPFTWTFITTNKIDNSPKKECESAHSCQKSVSQSSSKNIKILLFRNYFSQFVHLNQKGPTKALSLPTLLISMFSKKHSNSL